ncbi:MAG: glycine zipper 2TM domain-containing protein [Betaproteobacteria bacterium]|nr:glycine zipper 2TM domain-containing protein [Betaproteobacteria bacterium]
MKPMPIVVAALAAVLAAGCASSKSGSAYERREARREMTVRLGVVESVRQVTLEGTKSPVGTAGGAVVGGVAGSNVGGGKGAVVGTVLGAIIGGVAGSAVEEGVTRREGVELTVKLDNGQLIAVTQEADEVFRPGERVRVLSGGGETRVSH